MLWILFRPQRLRHIVISPDEQFNLPDQHWNVSIMLTFNV